eukprot:gene30382-39622_t
MFNTISHHPSSSTVADSAHHHVSSTSSNNTNWLDDDDQQQDDQNNEVENEEEEVPNISLAHSVGQIQNQNQKRKAVRKKKRSFIWHLVQVFPDPETAEAFIRQNKTLAVHRKNVDAAGNISIKYYQCSKRLKCDVITRLRYSSKAAVSEVYLESNVDPCYHIHSPVTLLPVAAPSPLSEQLHHHLHSETTTTTHSDPQHQLQLATTTATATTRTSNLSSDLLTHSLSHSSTAIAAMRATAQSASSSSSASSSDGQGYISEGCFGSYLASEALPGALPVGQNSPLVVPYGLYAEQLSGTAFTAAPRSRNLRSWLYRIRPSVCSAAGSGDPASPTPSQYRFLSGHIRDEFLQMVVDPNPLRWDPPDAPNRGVSQDFVEGLRLLCGSGDPCSKTGLAIYTYTLNRDMTTDLTLPSTADPTDPAVGGGRVMYNADGDLLLGAGEGSGEGEGEGEEQGGDVCMGYVLETFGGHFELPGLGPIGSNGLANPRDFKPALLYDSAWTGLQALSGAGQPSQPPPDAEGRSSGCDDIGRPAGQVRARMLGRAQDAEVVHRRHASAITCTH